MSETNGNGKWPLPEGWVEVSFDDAVTLVSVSGKKVQKGDYQLTGALPIIDQGQEFIGGYSDDSSMALEAEPPLIVFGDHTRVFKYVGFPFAAGADGIKVLKPRNFFDPKFVYYALTNLDLPNKGYSRHFQYLRKSTLPLPPLDDQHRIVAEIEKQFTRLDAAVAALKRAKANLARYKAAVLKAAVEGRLVQQNPNDEPAAALLARILAERRAQWEAANPKKQYVEPKRPDVAGLPELPVGWVWATVEEVLENHDARRIPVKRDDRSNMQGVYPYYGASGVIDYVDDFLFEGEYLLIGEDGANLLARSSPIAFQASGQFWVNNHAHVLQSLGNCPLGYFEAYINSIDLTFFVTGSAQPKLTQANLNKISIPFPPLREQHRIVAELERHLSIIKASEDVITVNFARAERLRQAVLGKAFRGELV